MSHTEEFLSGFFPLPEKLTLPSQVSAVYEPVSSLSRREDFLKVCRPAHQKRRRL